MELIANYLGNYKKQTYAPDTIGSTDQNHQSSHDSDGPIIISSNNYYSWGDLLTFRYIGEKNVGGAVDVDPQHRPLHPSQPIGGYFPDTMVSAPIHLRYHTISRENPVTIIQTVDNAIGQAIVVFKIIESDDDESKYIAIVNDSSEDICVDIYINMETDTPSSNQNTETWVLSDDDKFLLTMDQLFMLVMKPKYNPKKAFMMIIEASPSFDQNLPDPADISLEAFVENFVNQTVDDAVANLYTT